MTPDEKVEALQIMLFGKGWLEVVKPALEIAINDATDEWATGRRTEQDKNVSDEGLKQRVFAFKWMLNWERTHKNLVESLEAVRQKMAEEPADGV